MKIYYETGSHKVNVVCDCGEDIDFSKKTRIDENYIKCKCGAKISTLDLRWLRDISAVHIAEAINKRIKTSYGIK